MTPKQKRFCECLVADPKMNVTRAAIAANYSPATAGQAGSRLMTFTHIRAYIDQLQEERSRRTRIDADYVLQRLSDIDQMDIGDILNDDNTLKPIRLWPKIWRQMVSQFDAKTGKVKIPEKAKIIELAGKHIGVRAFAELVEVDVKAGFGERLAMARAKAAAKKVEQE